MCHTRGEERFHRRRCVLKSKLIGIAQLVLLLSGSFASAEAHDPPDFEAAFDRLKGLVGTWQVEERDTEVSYSLTGNGSALVEVFGRMASVYHMDGQDLRVTHYCGADNQPRMKAVSYDPAKGTLSFDFLDITNLSAPDAYHTRQIEIVFEDEDHIEIRFNGIEAGEEVPVTRTLRRK
jgi:hypothetical protein